jgi:hypothetical protein
MHACKFVKSSDQSHVFFAGYLSFSSLKKLVLAYVVMCGTAISFFNKMFCRRDTSMNGMEELGSSMIMPMLKEFNGLTTSHGMLLGRKDRGGAKRNGASQLLDWSALS